MDYEMSLNDVNAEINQILSGSGDTIYFDADINTFRIEYHCGYEIGLSLDRLIDIL